MLAYLGQRFLTLLLVMLVLTMVIFGLMHAVPGGPFDMTQQPLPPARHSVFAGTGRCGYPSHQRSWLRASRGADTLIP